MSLGKQPTDNQYIFIRIFVSDLKNNYQKEKMYLFYIFFNGKIYYTTIQFYKYWLWSIEVVDPWLIIDLFVCCFIKGDHYYWVDRSITIDDNPVKFFF